jgi:uncharacterized membrane protein (UPF0136 family)
MMGPAKIYFIVFGVLTIVGGVFGYLRAGSMASIIAGSVSGVLLLVAALLLPGNATAGLVLAGIVSLVLAARFLPAFMRTQDFMPAGMMALLSVIGIVMAVLAWVKR